MILTPESPLRPSSPYCSHLLLHLLLLSPAHRFSWVAGLNPQGFGIFHALERMKTRVRLKPEIMHHLGHHPGSSPTTRSVTPPSSPPWLVHLHPSPEPLPLPVSLWSKHSSCEGCANSCHTTRSPAHACCTAF